MNKMFCSVKIACEVIRWSPNTLCIWCELQCLEGTFLQRSAANDAVHQAFPGPNRWRIIFISKASSH